MNGDGVPDLVGANYGNANVSVWLNRLYLANIATAIATGTISHDGIFASGFGTAPTN